MAVSYLSKTIQPAPYVLPLDLNLFERVMSVKQKQFDLGAEKVQKQVNDMGMLDVIKDSDREYLNGKINNVVSSINSMGGIDYSDRQVLGQIEGMGSEIYGDDKVINAISSTRSVRNLVKTYHDFKTNPKLSKMYSTVNEALDMRKVNEWMADGQAGTSYSGPSTATPYVAYRDNHMKMFEKIKADKVETIDDKGLYILKESHERVTPERLMAEAAQLLTPEERGQMKRDAIYLYDMQSPTPPEVLIDKSLKQYKTAVSNLENIHANYLAQAKASSSDPKLVEQFTKLAESTKENIDSLKSQEANVVDNAIKSYKADPDEFKYQIYSNDYFTGLASRFAVNKVERSVQFDQAEMFQQKMQQAKEFHDDDMAIELAKIEADMLGKGTVTRDPKTGKLTVIPDDALTSNNTIEADLNQEKVTEKSIVAQNNNLLLEKDKLSLDFINNIVAERPDLEIVTTSKNGSGVARMFKGQEMIEGANGRRGFQMDDLAALDANRAKLRTVITAEQFNYLKTIYSNFTMMTQGKGGSLAELPEGAAELIEKHSLLDEAINANKTKMQNINDTVFATVKNKIQLTDQEIALYNDYKLNPKKYELRPEHRGLSAGARILKSTEVNTDPRITAIIRKMSTTGVDVDAEKQQYYNAIPTADVFRTKIFTTNDPLIKGGKLQNFIAAEQSRLTGAQINPDNVKPISAGMSTDGSGKFYVQASIITGSGANESITQVKIPVDDKNAKAFNLHRDPYENLNYSVNLNGRSGDLPVYGSKDLAINVSVVKRAASDNNGGSYFTQVKYDFLDKNGRPTGKYQLIKMPATEGRTASESYVLAKTAIKEAAKQGITYDKFKEYLANFKKP